MDKTLEKLIEYAEKYDISIQFWGEGNTNVFIEKDGVELTLFGGLTAKTAIKETVKYLDRITRKEEN